MMRVALDTNGLYTTQAGVARYISGLLKGLRQLGYPGLELLEVAWKVENFKYAQPVRALKTAYRELLWAKFVAPRILRQSNPDILHSLSGFFIEPPAPIKNIVTLHDLAPIRFPKRFRPWQRLARTSFFSSLHEVEAIICVSQFTADEAMRLLGLPASKLHVVHSGLELQMTENQNRDTNRSFTLPPEFFMFVGSLEPGKNLSLLREVYLLADALRKALPPLLVVGARWEGVPQEGKPPATWMYLGRQPDDVLWDLYEHARALIFPSKYEGFGFPILEAQINGCPVICSPIASLPEVGGPGALYVNPTPEAYLSAMERIMTDNLLRAQLVAAGRENSSKFSWKKCASETVEIYAAANA